MHAQRRILIPLLLLIIVSSCRKSDRDYDTTIKASTDEALAQDFIGDIMRLTDDAAKKEFGKTPQYYTGLLSCAVVTSNTSSSPATMSINYGSTGCIGPDGRKRSGQLDFTFTSSYMDSGNVITITPANYYIQEFRIEGSIQVKNLGLSGDEMRWKITSNDLKITYPDGEDYMTWSPDLRRTWVDGQVTSNVTDDIYQVTGSCSGRSHSGNTFSGQILSSLIFDMGCPHINEGTISLIPDNLNERIIDFGEGDCDTLVTVSINGIDYALGLQ